MSLDSLLGPRVKTITSSNKPQLSPKELLIKETEDQIRLQKGGDGVPKTTMKENGKVVKDTDKSSPTYGKTLMVPIKSWFNDKSNQFKPTPSNVTFLQGTDNCYDIGNTDRGQILEMFLKGVKDGSFDEDLKGWDEKIQLRNKSITQNRK